MTGTSGPSRQPPVAGEHNTLVGQTSFIVPTPTSGQFAFEDPAAAAHKRQLELDEAAHTRQKELLDLRRQMALQSVVLVILLIVVAACLWVMVRPGYPATTTDKAIGILVAVVSGFVGYVTGQVTKK